MVVEAKRKKGETFESFVRRFNRKMMQSGTILDFKRKSYKKKPVSRNRRQTETLARKVYKSKREYLKKTGRLPEEEPKKGRRR